MRRRSSGFSMIELMVGIVIALIGTVLILQVFRMSEQRKRVTTGASDAVSNGAYAAYYLQSVLGGAGNGIATMQHACGCHLTMKSGGNSLFPAAGPASASIFPPASGAGSNAAVNAAFKNVLNFQLNFSPLYIVPGANDNTPDALVEMAGNGQGLATPIGASAVTAGPGGKITLANNVGVTSNDLILGVSRQPAGVCAISQITLPAAPNLNSAATLAGTYALSDFMAGANNLSSDVPLYNDLGTAASLQFLAFAIGQNPNSTLGAENNTLISYNMVTGAYSTVAENVVNLKALYITNQGATVTPVKVGTAAGSTWNPASLNANGLGISEIMGVRLAIVTRNGQPEKSAITTSPLVLFSDLAASLQSTMTFTGTQQNYRYTVTDVTIPFRNMQLAGGGCS